MSDVLTSTATNRASTHRVLPSRVAAGQQKSFTLEQELEPFGSWVGKPIWVPPKDNSEALAEAMLAKRGLFTSQQERWSAVIRKHRSDFTQVREIELSKASIRLPQGKFFVKVTEQHNFDKITDNVPSCVQTRLDEFLAGRGQRPGVKVYYLKPLCVEIGNELILTSREDMQAAIDQVKQEVFAAYRRRYVLGLPRRILAPVFNAVLALPRGIVNAYISRQRKAIEAYHARLEFKRRQTALEAAKTHRKCRTTGCTYEEMLALTSPLDTADVVEQYGIENDLSRAQRAHLLQVAVGTLPWFVALSIGTVYLAGVSLAAAAAPVAVADPAFVAEFPEARGVLMKIGHFDEIGGVTHVEI